MHIFFRTCVTDFNQWKHSRPFMKTKLECTLTCLYSLLKSMRREMDYLTIINNHSLQEHKDIIIKLINYFDIRFEYIELNTAGGWETAKITLEMMKNSSDSLLYTTEDDYLHKTKSISTMEYFLLTKPSYICFPVNHADLYDSEYIREPFKKDIYPSEIIVNKDGFWRKIKTTTTVYAMNKSIFNKHYDELINSVSTIDNYIKHSHNDIYTTTPCFAPLPSLCGHISEMCMPLYEEWDKKYIKKYKKLNRIISFEMQ